MAGKIKVVPADQAPPLVAAAPAIAAPTPQPTSHALPAKYFGQPVGTAAFRDDKARSDQIVLDVKLNTTPPANQSLVAFLTTIDNSAAQNLGELKLDEAGGAHLVFSAPDGANLVAGSRDPKFGDLNGDGHAQNPGDGFGLLQNGEQAGYIKATSDAAVAAENATDATAAVKAHSEHVRICAENMKGWAAEAHDLA